MPWQELVKVALLGTENSSLPEPVLQDLQTRGIDIRRDPAQVVLEAAAYFTQLKKAGFLLSKYEGELPAATVVDAEKNCSIHSIHHLGLILDGPYGQLLPEFLELLLENGKYLPAEHLPSLLKRTEVRHQWEQLSAALDETGRWLLAQHPDWNAWLGSFVEVDWHTAGRAERLEWLQRVRKIAPEIALSTLQSTWESEDYRDRAAFLGALKTGLSLADEPFLESCLNDKRKEVRTQAAAVLVELPGAALSERMFQRAAACLQWRHNSLKINIPDKPDEGAERDGILAIHPAWRGGAKAGHLGQLMAAVSPERWVSFFEKPPAEILPLFAATDWQEALLGGLVEAAVRFKNADWTDALAAAWFDDPASLQWNVPAMEPLLQQVSPATLNRLALSFFDRMRRLPGENEPVFQLLRLNKNRWDNRLSISVLQQFRVWLAKAVRPDWQHLHYKELLHLLSLRCDPALYAQLSDGWDRNLPLWGLWEKHVENMLASVLFRKTMSEELCKRQ
jgi:hypothetical protein